MKGSIISSAETLKHFSHVCWVIKRSKVKWVSEEVPRIRCWNPKTGNEMTKLRSHKIQWGLKWYISSWIAGKKVLWCHFKAGESKLLPYDFHQGLSSSTLWSTVPRSELKLFRVSPLWNSHILHVLDVGGSWCFIFSTIKVTVIRLIVQFK